MRVDLVEAVETRDIRRLPTSLPRNRLLRSIQLVAWVTFGRGVPPRRAALAVPSFDPEFFLSLREDPRWTVAEGAAHLSARVLSRTLGAMSQLVPFIEPTRRASWTLLLGALRELHRCGHTLRCTWLED